MPLYNEDIADLFNMTSFLSGLVLLQSYISIYQHLQSLTINFYTTPPFIHHFYNVIKQHKRRVVKTPLVYKNNYYIIDFNDFEEKLTQGVKAFILCSPHNPVGTNMNAK